MNETPKSPCRGCDNEFDNKNDEPCASCPLPGQYDEALKKGFFPSVKFLRTATQPKTDPVTSKNKNVGGQDQKLETKEDKHMPQYTQKMRSSILVGLTRPILRKPKKKMMVRWLWSLKRKKQQFQKRKIRP